MNLNPADFVNKCHDAMYINLVWKKERQCKLYP